jgi:hypothetical protein
MLYLAFGSYLIHISYMHVILDPDLVHKTSASSGASIRASSSTKFQRPSVENAVLSEAVARDKAVMTRLMSGALAGTISAMAVILTTMIDWTVLEWRYFWLAVCVTAFVGLITFISMACARF